MRALSSFAALVAILLAPLRAAGADAPVSPLSPLSPVEREAVLALYNEGKELVDGGHVEEGCRKFEGAKKLDPTALNLLLRLGDCYERLGRFRLALREYDEAIAAASAARDPRGGQAEARKRALDPRVPRLFLSLAPGDDGEGIVVRLDGATLPRASLGVGLPVDPGAHTIEARAPGKRPWSLDQRADEGSRVTVVVPRLVSRSLLEAREPSPPGPAEPPSFGARRTLAVVAGAVGIAALGAGSAFGVKAMQDDKGSKDGHCDPSSYCDSAGFELRRQAQQAGDLSTVFFTAGAVALATGVVLFVLPRSSPPPSASRSVGPVRVALDLAPRSGGGALVLEGRY